MKKMFVLLLAAVLMLTGIASAQNDTMDPLYRDLITGIAGVLNGQDSGKLSAGNDYSLIIPMLAGQPDNGGLGYLIADVDGDGTDELLIGFDNDYTDGGTVFYDMYTIRDGQMVHIFTGWDRSRYYLGSNGAILYQGSSSAFESYNGYYAYSEGEMVFVYSVIYNSSVSPSDPWFLSCYNVYDVGGARSISEKEALTIMANMTGQKVNLLPFN